MKRWLSYLSQLLFAITLLVGFSSVVNADEIVSFNFMDKGNTSFIIGANGSTSGEFSMIVEDSTQAKPYINLLIATTGYPDFVITENEYFANTVIKKLYSSGTTNINGYTADLYVVQFATRGTSWSCSAQGLNCYVRTNLSLNNSYPYNSMYQLQSIALTDSVLTDDYLANMQINQNNQIIEQGKETNEKLDNLDDTIQSGNQAIKDSIEESNKETQNVIKDQFNECRDSVNLFNKHGDFNYPVDNFTNRTSLLDDGTIRTTANYSQWASRGLRLNLKKNTTYALSGELISSTGVGASSIAVAVIFAYDGSSWINLNNNFLTNMGSFNSIFNSGNYLDWFISLSANGYVEYSYTAIFDKIQIEEGKVSTNYEEYGKEICTNKLDKQNETAKGIWATIKDLPNQFLNMLKGLFIPDEKELQSLIDEFKSTMETKLGAIYQVGDLIVSVFDSILNPSEKNSCLTFPEIKDPMFDKLLIEETDYCFDSLRNDFDFLFALSDMIISIICTLAFGNMLYRKFEAFIGGVTSDY